jgi:hypothetical protein
MRFAPLLLALFASTVLAGPAAPPLDIKGAEKPVPADDFVELWAEPPAQKPAGWVGVTYEWQVFSGLQARRFRTFSEDGRDGIYFVPPKNGGKLLVTLTAAHLFLDGSKASVRTAKAYAVVTIEGGKVDPPSGPVDPPVGPVDPPVSPPPSIPDGKFKVARGAYDNAMKVPAPARSKALALAAPSRHGQEDSGGATQGGQGHPGRLAGCEQGGPRE